MSARSAFFLSLPHARNPTQRFVSRGARRRMSRDPLGFDASDTNLYRYVRNDPTNMTDPLGQYDDDVHFYMTFFLGLAVGLDHCCAQADPAFQIAWADAYTDYNPKTQPITLSRDILRRFHFRSTGNDVAVTENSAAAREVAEQGVKCCDPLLTGIGLHALQDSFSHAGFSAAGTGALKPGHSSAGHSPDDPSRDVAKALRMAKTTFDILKEYAAKCCGIINGTQWGDVEGDVKRQFALGEQEQKLSYEDQTKAREKRWRQLIKDKFGRDIQFDKDYKSFVEAFEEAAGKVQLPVPPPPPLKRMSGLQLRERGLIEMPQ
jgi:hypothetical protein